MREVTREILLRSVVVLSVVAVILLIVFSARSPSVVEVREGDLYVNQKKDAGKYDMVHASWCGCCGSDFADWLYVPKSFNFTVGCSYHITVYGEYIVDFEVF